MQYSNQKLTFDSGPRTTVKKVAAVKAQMPPKGVRRWSLTDQTKMCSALLLSLYTRTTSYLISLHMMSLVMSKQRREFSIKYTPEHDLYYLYVLEARLTQPASL